MCDRLRSVGTFAVPYILVYEAGECGDEGVEAAAKQTTAALRLSVYVPLASRASVAILWICIVRASSVVSAFLYMVL